MASILNVDKLRATGSTTDGLTVDTSGRVLTPARPAFWVGMGTSTSAANTNVIVFDTVKKNDGSHYSTSNGRFIPPLSGWYQFTFSVLYQSVGTGDDDLTTFLRVNGSNNNTTWLFDRADGTDANGYSGFGGYLNSRGAAGLYLDANDYVELYYSCSGPIQVHGNNNANWSQWSGYLIG